MGRAGMVSSASVTTIWATTKDFGGDDWAKAVVVQSNGQVVVAGTAAFGDRGGTGKIALTRYNPDLTPDLSFGVGGTVTNALVAGKENDARAMVLDATATGNQGKFVVAGAIGQRTGSSGYDFAVARYTTSGVLDTSFGGGQGFARTDVSGRLKGSTYADDAAYAVAIDNTPGTNYDKVVAAGYATTSTGTTVALVRYTATGALDTTFNSGGPIPGTLEIKLAGVAVGVAIDSSGNYVVTGSVGNPNHMSDPTSNGTVFLARVTPSGTLDASFGNGGIVQTTFGYNNDGHLSGLAIDAGDNIVVVGDADPISGSGLASTLVARYTPTGVLDASFGGGAGYIFSGYNVHNGSQAFRYNAVAIQPGTGAIYAAGRGYLPKTDPTFYPASFIVSRYTTAGALDTTFNGTGEVSYSFANASNGQTARALALGPNGDVALAGELQPAGSNDWGVVHIQP